MVTGIVLGAVLGLGMLLIGRGLRPQPVPLEAALRELERPRWSGTPAAAGWRGRAQRWALGLDELPGARSTRRDADLAILERSLEAHALDRLLAAALGAGLPLLFSAVVTIGGIQPAPTLVLIASVLGAVGGYGYPEVTLRSEARQRRRDFRHALGAFLELVTIILAGGGGVESALDAAASTGTGWAFARLRHALVMSRLSHESPWAVLDRLAAEIDLPELAELSSSVGLAGDAGAKVRASLAAKAASMREHELAQAQAEAEAASERMSAPVVLMLTGFILLIGYPAVANVLSL
jgi:Flp pilus assembly protein TadB